MVDIGNKTERETGDIQIIPTDLMMFAEMPSLVFTENGFHGF